MGVYICVGVWGCGWMGVYICVGVWVCGWMGVYICVGCGCVHAYVCTCRCL